MDVFLNHKSEIKTIVFIPRNKENKHNGYTHTLCGIQYKRLVML